MKGFKLIITILLIAAVTFLSAGEGKVIELGWDAVVIRCRLDNLNLKMDQYDYRSQQAEVKKAWGSFLPSLDYQWVWTDDESDDASLAMAYQNAEVPENMFVHSLQLTFPLFTGGSRYANLKLQSHLQKSLTEELRGREDGEVLKALQAYYSVILADAAVGVYAEALDLSEANLRQVENFQEAGVVTELAVMQARTQYFETIPLLADARNQKKLAIKQMKFILNIAEEDSLKITEILSKKDFLRTLKSYEKTEIIELAVSNRPEIKQMHEQLKAAGQQKALALSQFFPTVAFTAGAQHLAYDTDWDTERKDFERYNSIGLAVQYPIFSGGNRWFSYKQAGYAQKKAVLMQEQLISGIKMETEQAYYNYIRARDNLKSLEESLLAAQESLRLANMYYEKGMSNQTEVLNARLSYTRNRLARDHGIYEYNTSQLSLLKSAGKLPEIWNKQGEE